MSQPDAAGPPVRNQGSVGAKKITFVGASYKFVHRVLRDMLIVGGFEDVRICLHDIAPEPLELVGDLLERIARQKRTRIAIERTLDQEQALRGADVVVLSITTGGRESDCRSFEVCLKYGIPVGVGDTLGPAALARNLRTVPVVVDLVRRMEDLCPGAALLNFTNPMSALTAAMARRRSIPVWGLCHSADELYSYFAKVFGCAKSELDMDVGGVNHQAFVTRLAVGGRDRTADILGATEASEAAMEDSLVETRREEVDLQQDVFKVLGAWPSTGGTHLAEFYPFFFTDRRIGRFAGHMRSVVPGRARLGPSVPHPILSEWAYGPDPVGDLELMTTEHAHELMWSFLTGEPFTRVLNVLNDGDYLQGIPRDACVEAKVTVAGRNATGGQLRLPPAVHSLVERWTTIHDLSIAAALGCDRDAARRALFLDPHVRDLYDIAPMLEDILEATREWLPARWFARGG